MKTAPKNRKDRSFSIDAICDAFSLKRDAYYKYQKRFLIKKQQHDSYLIVHFFVASPEKKENRDQHDRREPLLRKRNDGKGKWNPQR